MEIVVPDAYRHLWVCDRENPILKVPDPGLRTKAAPVASVTNRHRVLIENMVRIMRQADGVGLAAPQIGVHERIVVVAPDSRPLALLNPVIEEQEGACTAEEGCLSLPGLYGMVERAERIVVRALDRKGAAVTYEMEGIAARVAQHEVDHLDGVLFIDKADPATLHWMMPGAGAAE
jgi:peptide deformylase